MPEQEVGLRLSLKERRETARGLAEVDQGLDRTGRSAETAGRRARLGSKGFAALGRAAKVGFLGVAAGVAGLAAASAGFVKSAAEDQKSARKLAVSLRNTTGARKRDITSIENWISAQGKALGVADDDLRPAISTLATATGDLTKARKLTTLANNIAVGKDKSLASVATALGKAYTGNVSGLGRLGIATKNAQGETLTFDQVQRKLARTFNGQAAAAADTASGKYDRFKLALSETGEAIGYELLPYATKLGDWLVAKGIPLVEQWGGRIGTDVIPAIQRFVKRARPLAEQVLPAVSDGLGTIRDVAKKIEGPLTRTFKAFNDLPDWAKSAIAIGAGGAVVAKKVGALSFGKKAASSIVGVASKAKPVPVFVTNPGFAGAGGGTAAARVGKYAGALGVLGPVGAGIAAAIGGNVVANKAIDKTGLAPDRTEFTRYGLGIVGPLVAALRGGAPPQPKAPVTNADRGVSGSVALSGLLGAGMTGKVRRSMEADVLGPLAVATDKTKSLGAELGKVGRTRVEPKVNPIGFDPAQRSADTLQGTLRGIGGTPFTATVDLDASAAYAKLAALRAAGQFIGPIAPPVVASTPPTSSSKPSGDKRRSATLPDVNPIALAASGGGYPGSTPLQLTIDGRVMADVTLDQLAGQQARR